MRTLHHTWSINAQLTSLVNSSRKLKSQLPWKSDSFLLRHQATSKGFFNCKTLPSFTRNDKYLQSFTDNDEWFFIRTVRNLFVVQPSRYHAYMLTRGDLFYFALGSCCGMRSAVVYIPLMNSESPVKLLFPHSALFLLFVFVGGPRCEGISPTNRTVMYTYIPHFKSGNLKHYYLNLLHGWW